VAEITKPRGQEVDRVSDSAADLHLENVLGQLAPDTLAIGLRIFQLKELIAFEPRQLLGPLAQKRVDFDMVMDGVWPRSDQTVGIVAPQSVAWTCQRNRPELVNVRRANVRDGLDSPRLTHRHNTHDE
jgi:hypothetical protein